jgi:IclR family acetate operon transcriptional repressor
MQQTRKLSPEKNTHRAVEKALDILLAFLPHNPEMGTLELSSKTGYHKSTVSRLLHVLANRGFLQQNPQTKKFQLGLSSLSLGVAVKKSLESNLVPIAKPFIDALRDKLNEAIALEVFSGTNTILAYLAKGPDRINLAGNVGDILSLHAAAGAKAILAFSRPEVRDGLLKDTFPALTPNTLTDPNMLQRQLDEIVRTGFSFDNEEHDMGTTAIGVPIFNDTAEPIAALVALGPYQRIKPDWDSPLAHALKETAQMISKQLHCKPHVLGTGKVYEAQKV